MISIGQAQLEQISSLCQDKASSTVGSVQGLSHQLNPLVAAIGRRSASLAGSSVAKAVRFVGRFW